MTLTARPPDWTEEAPCQGRSSDFHPNANEGSSSLRVRRAKRVCSTCPFIRDCLEECYREKYQIAVIDSDELGDTRAAMVLKDSSHEGVWGGTTPLERRAVAHLPLPQRINVLLAWGRSDTVGPFATRSKEAV